MAPMLARVQAVTSAAQGLPVGERVEMLAAQGLPVGERVEMLASKGLPVGERVEMLAAKGLPVGVQAVTSAAKGLLVALLVAMLFCGAGSAAAQTLKIGNNVKTVKVGEGAAVSVTKDQTVQAPARTKVRIKATSPEQGLVPRLKLTKATTSSGGPVPGGGDVPGGEGGLVPENTSPTITVNPPADVSIYYVGVQYQFTTQITDPSAPLFSISWSVAKQSDNQDGSFVSTNDASISQTGVFYATLSGTYRIIATADNDLGISGPFYILVEDAPSSPGTDVDPGITPGGIVAAKTMMIRAGNESASVRPGEKMGLIATDKEGHVLHPTWTLFNNSLPNYVSFIDSDTGIFTAGSQEEICFVGATLFGYNRATFQVTVSSDAPEFTPVREISIPSPNGLSAFSKNSTYPLQAFTDPDNASIKNVKWAVSGSDILGYPLAEIDPYTGVLKTFNSHGDITVTATALDGSDVVGSMTLSIE